MPDYAGEPVTIKAVDPVDEDGTALNNTNAAAAVDIYTADDLSTPILSAVMPWNNTAGQFRFRWDTTGQDPGSYMAKVTVTPTGGIGSFEWKQIDLAGPPVSVTQTCRGPWVVPDDLSSIAGLEEDDRLLVVEAASELLFNATAQKFIGVCTDVVRPPAANCVGGLLPGTRLADGSLWLGVDGLSSLPESTFGLGGIAGTVVGSPVMVHSSVRLPGFPIIAVTKITIDGTDLPDGSWRIVDDRDVVRADGGSWPLWQRLDRAAGDDGTWTIEYTWGTPVPASGRLAARVLSAELGLSLNQDTECRLPRRLQSITREGLTSIVLDPFTFLDKGGFGIYEVDTFINSWNPHHITREARVLNPDLMAVQPRRIR